MEVSRLGGGGTVLRLANIFRGQWSNSTKAQATKNPAPPLLTYSAPPRSPKRWTVKTHANIRTATQAVQNAQQRPTIEIPAKTDVSWPGHRFSLRSAALSALSRVSTPAKGIALLHDPTDKLSAFDSSESESSSPAGSAVSQESHVPALAELSCYRSAGKSSLMTVTQPGEVQKPRTPGAHGVWSVPVTPAQER